MTDVRERRIHLLELGSGNAPTVVIVPAIGGTVLDWLGFCRQLAEDTPVCVYDRAGFGWSDAPPRRRRGFDEMALELRSVLANSGVQPPFLLVGHSIGGIITRRVAAHFPADVAGIVLIDSSHEEQARRHLVDKWPWRCAGAPTASYAVRCWLRILGLRRLRAERSWGRLRHELAKGIPPDHERAAVALALTARHRRAVVHELLLNSHTNGRPPNLGDLPMTVLTAADRDPSWGELQAELASLSTQSTHITADAGGHYLQRDNPALVLSAIRDLHTQIKATASGT